MKRMKYIHKVIIILAVVLTWVVLAAAKPDKKTVLFCTFQAANEKDTRYLEILQPLVARQTIRNGLYTVKRTSQAINVDLPDEQIRTNLVSLSKRHKANYIVYGFVSSDPDIGIVKIAGFVYSTETEKITELETETTETGARFINGCDLFSNQVSNAVIQLDMDIKIDTAGEDAENTVSTTPNL